MHTAPPPVKPVPEPGLRPRRRLWRLDPAALDPQFPFEWVRHGRRWRRGWWRFALALLLMAAGVALSIGIINNEDDSSDALAVIVTAALFTFGLVASGVRASRHYQWRDKRTGQPVERTALRLVGDERVAFDVMNEIHRQSIGGPMAWRPLTDGKPWKTKRRRARIEGVVIINVYAPARELHPAAVTAPALVTARAVPKPRFGEITPLVLPPQVVQLNWAHMVLAAALGTSAFVDGGTSGGGYSDSNAFSSKDDWKCDDGSEDGGDCSDSGDGGDSGGDGDGGGDGGD